MAAHNRAVHLLIFLCLFYFVSVQGDNPVNVPLDQVPLILRHKAWKALNNYSPTHHRYAHGDLINAQELEEPPYKVYKFTYDLNPICGTETCPREACTIDVRQDENGAIEPLNESIQCMYFYPAETQNDVSQEQQSEQSEQSANYQEQDNAQVTESLAEQINSNQSVELTHEVQETDDENSKPFIAVRATASNYCPGCPYELNPNLPGLLAFAGQALKSMDEQTMSDYKHKLMSIIRITRAVPPSSNVIQYQLLMLIGESMCSKNTLEQEDCALREGAPVQTCLVTFEKQPWQHTPPKITNNNCTNPENIPTSSIQPQNLNLESQTLITVNYNERQPSESDAYEGLKDMLNNYTYVSTFSELKDTQESAVTEPTIVRVVLNRTQDDEQVTGFSDKINEFNEFLLNFDLPVKMDVTPDTREGVREEEFQRRTVSAENLKANEKIVINRKKRSAKRQVGAPNTISIEDPEVQLFVQKGLHKFSQDSEGTNEPIIVEITDASVQIVSGKLYKIKTKLGTSNCPKGTKENCQLLADSEVKECLITVWSRPWLDISPEITVECPPRTQRRKRSLRGVNYSKKMLQIAEDVKKGIEAKEFFENFITTYNRTYSSVEEKFRRFDIFIENLDVIKFLQRSEQGTGQYGINMFADLTREEFRKHYLGLRPDLRLENDIPLRKAEIPNIDIPSYFDWRQKHVVTPVKDQGACGSCWAFSVTGNVEGQYAIKHGKLLSLSEQELVDCDSLDDGCSGGLPDNAYRAIEQLGGLELESDYPYEAEDEKCHFKKNMAKVQLASAVNITTNETQIAQWLVMNGPISIGINANAMQFYVGGVSHPMRFLCNPKNLDHGVLIVGYGTSNYPLFKKKLPYWIIKNSWGKRWGEQGYYRVYRGDGTCGLNTMPTSAMVV